MDGDDGEQREGGGCLILAGVVVVLAVVLAGGCVVATWRSNEDFLRDQRQGVEDEARRPARFALRLVDPDGDEVVDDHVLHLGRDDAAMLGLDDRTISAVDGILRIVSVHPEHRFCLAAPAPVVLHGTEVAVVPAGTCLFDGANGELPEVVVRR